MILARFGVEEKAVASLTTQKFSLREIALILTLAEHSGINTDQLSIMHRDKGLSWSEIAYNLGLQPADAGKIAGKSIEKQQ